MHHRDVAVLCHEEQFQHVVSTNKEYGAALAHPNDYMRLSNSMPLQKVQTS